MANELRRITEPHLLIVEGKDEVNFFDALRRHIGISGIQVEDFAGKNNLSGPDGLGVLKVRPGFNSVYSIGIVRDGDGDKKGAFNSVCSALRAADLPIPSEPLVLTNGHPRISVMIMPPVEVETDQMLEDLCLAAATDDPDMRSVMRCVDEYFNCLGEQANISHKKNVLPKARLHAYLASRPDPESRLGIAAQKGYIPMDSPVFKPVTDFLRQLAS